ncbi:MAG: UTRA domain-containing protein, partial [Peptococcaceae bacterium]|nr:UTRA domain-containing protein [Peptococcaceae bacterium]
PVYKLKTLLSDPGMDLYRAMKSVGLNPVTCEESLIASPATPEEEQQLFGASVVQRIKRKVFDSEGNLLEFCLLTDRADCYEFVYRFQLTE